MNKKQMLKKQEQFMLWEKIEKEASPATMTQYNRVTKTFVEALPEDAAFDKMIVIKYKATLLQRFAPSTVQNYLTILNKFIKFCSEPGQEDVFTVKNIKIQQRSSLEDVIEPDEFKRILRQAKRMGKDNYYLIMKIFAQTGIRISELSLFTYENVKNKKLTVISKGKIRNVPLRSDLRREILNYCKDHGITSGIIFRGRDPTKQLNDKTIWNNMRKIAGQARGINISKIHAHSFRHLFAIQYMAQFGDIAELADILGHSSIETTRIYTRTTDKQKKNKVEKMKF